MRDGLADLDIEMAVQPEHRLPMLNAVRLPAGAKDAGIHRRLLDKFNLEVGPGLGPLKGKIWRIGLVGSGARSKPVLFSVSAPEQTFCDGQVQCRSQS